VEVFRDFRGPASCNLKCRREERLRVSFANVPVIGARLRNCGPFLDHIQETLLC